MDRPRSRGSPQPIVAALFLTVVDGVTLSVSGISTAGVADPLADPEYRFGAAITCA